MVNAAVHLRGELEAMGVMPFVKTSGGKGVHIVVPIKPKLNWKQAHQASPAWRAGWRPPGATPS